jgi:UDP-glucose 4-epimerase
MRALITGGAGFIGSHLAETLIMQGHDVVVLDDLSTGRLENIAHLSRHPGFRCVIDSVTNEKIVAPLVEEADAVFHLAAAVGVKLVCEAPIHTIHTNVNGTETILEAARRYNKRIVVASTSEVYGKGTALPYREDADLVLGPPDKTRWGYACSKLMDEFLALAYAREHDLRVTVVRLFNTVGPRQSERYGMVLPNFVRWAIAGEPITIHGDGSQTRSFTWVGDVIWAMTTLINEPRAAGHVFNIGNGQETSIRDLARRVCELTGSASKLRFIPYQQAFDSSFEDMPRRVPDISKLRRLVGYEPRVHLDAIIQSVIRYWETDHTSRQSRAVPDDTSARYRAALGERPRAVTV